MKYSFILDELEYKDYKLIFNEPIELKIIYDKESNIYEIDYPRYGSHIWAYDRDKLYQFLLDEIDILWRHYAKEDDSVLSKKAIELKNKLLEDLKEEKNA